MYICKYCNKEFKSLLGLRSHRGHSHKNEILNEKAKVGRSCDEIDLTNGELLKLRKCHSNKYDVCGKLETANTHPKDKDYANALCVDHDHILKRFRGFLCVQCNRNFGWYDK